MSFDTALDTNVIIDRIEATLLKSPILFPEKNGGGNLPDLVRQIIKYQFPIPQQPPDGLGPPHVWINVAPVPIVNREPSGRGTRDVVAKELLTYEFWCVCVTQAADPLRSQQQVYTIASAVETAIGKNRRLTVLPGFTDPLCFGLSYFQIPFSLRSTSTDQAALNVIIRPKLFVDMTT